VPGAGHSPKAVLNALAKAMEDHMRGTNKAKETKRRTSQRRATHKARRSALGLRAETRMAAIEAEKGKTKVRSKRPVKSSKPEKR
jgi:hypothetical protein